MSLIESTESIIYVLSTKATPVCVQHPARATATGGAKGNTNRYRCSHVRCLPSVSGPGVQAQLACLHVYSLAGTSSRTQLCLQWHNLAAYSWTSYPAARDSKCQGLKILWVA